VFGAQEGLDAVEGHLHGPVLDGDEGAVIALDDPQRDRRLPEDLTDGGGVGLARDVLVYLPGVDRADRPQVFGARPDCLALGLVHLESVQSSRSVAPVVQSRSPTDR
jgi:hypothetical protein